MNYGEKTSIIKISNEFLPMEKRGNKVLK